MLKRRESVNFMKWFEDVCASSGHKKRSRLERGRGDALCLARGHMRVETYFPRRLMLCDV